MAYFGQIPSQEARLRINFVSEFCKSHPAPHLARVLLLPRAGLVPHRAVLLHEWGARRPRTNPVSAIADVDWKTLCARHNPAMQSAESPYSKSWDTSAGAPRHSAHQHAGLLPRCRARDDALLTRRSIRRIASLQTQAPCAKYDDDMLAGETWPAVFGYAHTVEQLHEQPVRRARTHSRPPRRRTGPPPRCWTSTTDSGCSL